MTHTAARDCHPRPHVALQAVSEYANAKEVHDSDVQPRCGAATPEVQMPLEPSPPSLAGVVDGDTVGDTVADVVSEGEGVYVGVVVSDGDGDVVSEGDGVNVGVVVSEGDVVYVGVVVSDGDVV